MLEVQSSTSGPVLTPNISLSKHSLSTQPKPNHTCQTLKYRRGIKWAHTVAYRMEEGCDGGGGGGGRREEEEEGDKAFKVKSKTNRKRRFSCDLHPPAHTTLPSGVWGGWSLHLTLYHTHTCLYAYARA